MEVKRYLDKVTIEVEGNEIGKITFYEENGKMVVDHTYVNPDYRGQNLGIVLVDAVVDIARNKKMKIIPVCPYVEKVFIRNEKYNDVYEKEHDYNVSCKIGWNSGY